MDLLTLFVFGCVATLTLGVASLAGEKPVRRRLTRLADGSKPVVDLPETSGLLDARQKPWERWLSALAGRAGGDAVKGTVRSRLIEAGYRRPSAITVYMGARVALAAGLPVLVLLLSVAWDPTRAQLLALVCGSAALGLVGPSFFIDRMRASRQLQIQLGLPDALDLMVVCVEAGLGINASLARVAKDFARSNPILAAEFELVVLEVRAGKSSTNALRSLSERTGVSDLRSLVAMLVQTEQFGTSVADTLRVQADAMRVQRMLRAEEQAGKAPVKMLFPTLIIFIATLIVTIGPGLMRMFAFFGEAAA